ncbi:MAG TPA: ABC transporter permease [Roseiflexaceae bacterium]|nr:ABC transporter permease [Roseiflexaceae bacterium]
MAEALASEQPALTVIEPERGWSALRLGELWPYRELLFFLIWRDIKVRYKQTALGAAWAIIQPLFTMLVFSLFFGQLARIEPPGGLPYWLFAYAGLVPWSFFASGLAQSSDSLVGSANLIRKVYFPRLVVPVATVLAGLVDFALAFAVLLAAMLLGGFMPGPTALLLPLFLLLAVVTAMGVGLWLSALNVQFRDVRYVVPFLVQIWLFATPIAYPSALITQPLLRAAYGLNPMVGVVEGFRWALLGGPPPGPMLYVSALASLLLLISGAFYFRRMERTFADLI